MSDHLPRIQLVHLEVDRLLLEARSCADLDRLVAIRAEMDVLLESMREIRREQLVEQLDPPKPERPRRWWQTWRRA